MSLALLFAGLLLLISAVRNSQDDLFALLQKDFTGPNNFVAWIIALVFVGAIGYIPKLKPLSIAFLTLVLIAIFLKKGTGFFDQISKLVNLSQGKVTV